VLEREELDVVSVATYTPAHAEITVACAAAGVRVIYCQAPCWSSTTALYLLSFWDSGRWWERA